jgi:hypothetical protein
VEEVTRMAERHREGAQGGLSDWRVPCTTLSPFPSSGQDRGCVAECVLDRRVTCTATGYNDVLSEEEGNEAKG